MINLKNEKNKSSVILNPERSEWVSRSHVTSVESVVNDGAKTKRYSAKGDLYARSPKGSRLKMTRKALSFLRLRGASGAQGIFAPVSCREAHKRRFLFNSWILRFANASLRMTIPVLALLFTFIATAESWAACTNGNPMGYMKDGKCVSCPSMPGYCEWKEEQGKAIMTGCAGDYILCGGSCKHPGMYNATSAHCEEATGNLVPEACTPGSRLKNGNCLTCSQIYGPCIECSYDEDGSGPIACKKCGSGYKAKNGTCLWGNPGDSCGNGYVEGDGVCYKIPDGCESASATDGSCTKCSARLSFDDDNNCIECNKKGYKNVGGYCNRVQWTPAEAAKVLHNDNTNEVTITFKK